MDAKTKDKMEVVVKPKSPEAKVKNNWIEDAEKVQITWKGSVYYFSPEDDGCIKMSAEDILGNKSQMLLMPYNKNTTWLKAEMV